MPVTNKNTALIAMSGGVDSSVAAYLMAEQGYDCVGTTMRLYRNEDIGLGCFHTCCSQRDIEDAAEVAFQLDIPYEVLDFARQRGLQYVVTGHYARIAYDAASGRWLLKKAADDSKDQSYVLYMLSQEQLAHIQFPLGDKRKTEVRALAEQLHFVNARKHDSQDICFVPDGDYVKFIEQYTGKHYAGGDFLDEAGAVVGKHRGAIRYTIGQRKGLQLAMGTPVYVCQKDMQNNTVSVGAESALYSDTLIAEELNWISVAKPEQPMRVKAKTRYRQTEQWATVYPQGQDTVRLVFDEPQRAMTVGQAVVMYDGDIVVGGGTITEIPGRGDAL